MSRESISATSRGRAAKADFSAAHSNTARNLCLKDFDASSTLNLLAGELSAKEVALRSAYDQAATQNTVAFTKSIFQDEFCNFEPLDFDPSDYLGDCIPADSTSSDDAALLSAFEKWLRVHSIEPPAATAARTQFTELMEKVKYGRILSKADTNTRVVVDETLANSIEWPTEKFDKAPEKGKHGGLVSFLRRVWKPVLDEHNVVMPLSLLAREDEEAAESIYNLRRRKIMLPPDLFILAETEVTELKIAADPAGMARSLIGKRRTRARIPGM